MSYELEPADEPCPDCGSTHHRACEKRRNMRISGKPKERYRFISDDDGHNCLISTKDTAAFEEWIKSYDEEYGDEYDGPDFSDRRIDSEQAWSFTDPKEDQ